MKDITHEAKRKTVAQQEIYLASQLNKGDCYVEYAREAFESTAMSGTPRENGQSTQERKNAQREAQMDNEVIKTCLNSLISKKNANGENEDNHN